MRNNVGRTGETVAGGNHREIGAANTIATFLDRVLSKRPEGETEWLFRGQRSGSRDPLPQIDRPEFLQYRQRHGWSRYRHENALLGDFKNGARPYANVTRDRNWEWLALAQHHGLATRLLDWSINPLVALYFAVESHDADEDSAVWCYQHSGASCTDPGGDALKIKEVTTFKPPHVSNRIAAQGGCFTAHPEDSMYRAWPGELGRITIPRAARDGLRRDLALVGITKAALFPGLDGIAATNNLRYSGPSSEFAV